MNLFPALPKQTLRGDVFGGITAAVVALPLAMAFGVASGAGATAGLYGAIFVGLFAALFGGTPVQISGPTGPMTVVMAAVFVQYTSLFPADPAYGTALAFTVVILGGLFQILFGLLKFGRYIELVPHPVVSGFMSGIGVIIILLQLAPLLGVEGSARPMDALMAIPAFFEHAHLPSLALGILSLFLVYGVAMGLPKLNRMVPAPLLTMVVGTLVYLAVLQEESGVQVIGAIPSGIPSPQMPAIEFDLLMQMLMSALTLAALGSIDSLLTSLVADNLTRTQHRPDRELIGQGIGNTVAGLFGGLPGAGATMRTVINVKAGGRSEWSGAIHALILLVMVLGAGGFAESIPKAVLAGILIKVGTDIIDWDYLKQIRVAPLPGILMMFSVLLMTVFFDLIQAVAFGVVMAAMVFVRRMTELQLQTVRIFRGDETDLPLLDAETQTMLAQQAGNIVVYQIGGPINFGAAKGMLRKLSEAGAYQVLVLDLSAVTLMDFSSIRALGELIDQVRESERTLHIVEPPPVVQNMLSRQGTFRDLMPIQRHFDLRSAVRYAANSRTDQA
jgi:SulP family sulfate permease